MNSKYGKKIFGTPMEFQKRWKKLFNRHPEVDESILDMIQQFPVKEFSR